jgi:hypothetical protein
MLWEFLLQSLGWLDLRNIVDLDVGIANILEKSYKMGFSLYLNGWGKKC